MKEPSMRKCFLLLTILTFTAAALTVESSQLTGTDQAPPIYVRNGFHAQIQSIVQHYRDGDKEKGRAAIDELRLPRAEDWFSEHLGPEHSAELTVRYDRLFANFADSLEATIKSVVANRSADLVTELTAGNGEKPSGKIRSGAKLSGMASVKQFPLFYAHFTIQMDKKDSVSWADTFDYEDGVFRFLGFGGWPFWAWEDHSEGGAPKGGSFVRPPVLMKEVAPIYPSSARSSRLEGVVLIHALIDKEGRVKSANILDGDPLLGQAALDAVRKWKYYPGTLGGAPTESETVARVVFALR
jgi:TonB family protein